MASVQGGRGFKQLLGLGLKQGQAATVQEQVIVEAPGCVLAAAVPVVDDQAEEENVAGCARKCVRP